MLTVLAGEDAMNERVSTAPDAKRLSTILAVAAPISAGDTVSLLSCDQSNSDTPGGTCSHHDERIFKTTLFSV
jgi:hypothetical protein